MTSSSKINQLKQQEDKWENARGQAQAQFESIKGMVKALEKAVARDAEESSRASCESYDRARQTIEEDALSVDVRSAWHSPGEEVGQHAAEYRILLCTGGPAVQITGELSEHGEPSTARLEMQDWFLPWTDYRPLDTAPGAAAHGYLDPNAEEILLAYARQFYFGE
jgi:hypothetical protein